MTQISQTAVCNRHHSVAQQLCRWLLLSLDRSPSNELAVTHDLIGSTLGVRREGVTEAVGRLKRAELIDCRRGYINVIDRNGLEKLACECYQVVKKEYDRLLPGVTAMQAGLLACGSAWQLPEAPRVGDAIWRVPPASKRGY